MRYREVAPHSTLRDYVRCFWALEHDYRSSWHDREYLWADGHAELIFTNGSRYRWLTRGRLAALPASFVIGPFTGEYQLLSRGRTSLVAARFWPWGLHAFSRVPMSALANRIRSARDVLGAAARSVGQALTRARTPELKVAALEHALLALLNGGPSARPRTRAMVTDITRAHGQIRIAELQRGYGIGARRLQRTFDKELGLSAKTFARIVRFNRAKHAIERNPQVRLSTLAAECGYADQAHFTAAFREMFHFTPGDFKRRMQRFHALERGESLDVVFLQDGATHDA